MSGPDAMTDTEQEEFGHIRSYVLRQGHLSSAQARFHADMMPKVGIPYQPTPLDLNTVFGRTAPKILEIGCGMGETTAQIALMHPENDYLGLEVHTPGVGSLCKLISEHAIANLRICQHDAVEVVGHMLDTASLDGIHIFFPDPWHKKRHHKRRLIQGFFVAELARCLKSGGYLHCATDWEDYAQQMLAVCSDSADLLNTSDGYAPRPTHRPQTKFETRGLRLGHGIWDVVFRRR